MKRNSSQIQKNHLQLDEYKKRKRFLEDEKCISAYLKAFLAFSFMLSAGGITLLFTQQEQFIYQIEMLCRSVLASITCYFLACIAFTFSMFVNDYTKFILFKKVAYSLIMFGFFIFIVSFDYMLWGAFQKAWVIADHA